MNTSDGRVVRAFHRFTLVDQSGQGRDLMKGRSRAQGAVKISCARQVPHFILHCQYERPLGELKLAVGAKNAIFLVPGNFAVHKSCGLGQSFHMQSEC